jgi:hypothetical protein
MKKVVSLLVLLVAGSQLLLQASSRKNIGAVAPVPHQKFVQDRSASQAKKYGSLPSVEDVERAYDVAQREVEKLAPLPDDGFVSNNARRAAITEQEAQIAFLKADIAGLENQDVSLHRKTQTAEAAFKAHEKSGFLKKIGKNIKALATGEVTAKGLLRGEGYKAALEKKKGEAVKTWARIGGQYWPELHVKKDQLAAVEEKVALLKQRIADERALRRRMKRAPKLAKKLKDAGTQQITQLVASVQKQFAESKALKAAHDEMQKLLDNNEVNPEEVDALQALQAQRRARLVVLHEQMVPVLARASKIRADIAQFDRIFEAGQQAKIKVAQDTQ